MRKFNLVKNNLWILGHLKQMVQKCNRPLQAQGLPFQDKTQSIKLLIFQLLSKPIEAVHHFHGMKAGLRFLCCRILQFVNCVGDLVDAIQEGAEMLAARCPDLLSVGKYLALLLYLSGIEVLCTERFARGKARKRTLMHALPVHLLALSSTSSARHRISRSRGSLGP